ncbi:MAG: SLC13 family permease [Pleurocapsa minor GSE-CHR-MK-17-07R]|jgi:di/tricarboxylate transporter|nr:SLC13 family permease [Pleurocapsa minor GSE-CHR-MK 17-07R]
MLTTPQIILNVIVLAALGLTLSNRLRSDLVALLVLLALALSGLVTPTEALSGLSNPAVMTLVGLFLISHGLEETGIAQRVAAFIKRAAGPSEVRLIVLFMGAGALLSLAMNNVAAGAVLLPVAMQVAEETRVSPSRLLMPLSFGTLVGGMATYFTTANIVISGLLVENGQAGLSMGDFLPTGGLIALVALLAMALFGRKLLPTRASVGTMGAASLSRALADTYGLNERLWELRVNSGSPLIDVTLADSSIGEVLGLSVLSIWRNGIRIHTPAPSEVLRPGDHVLIVGREDRVVQLNDWGMTQTTPDMSHFRGDTTPDLTEVIIPPGSSVLGKTLAGLRFRERTGLSCIAIWREGRSYRTDVQFFPLEVGDALLVVGSPVKIDLLARDPDYFVTRSAHRARPRMPQKAGIALLITALALIAAVVDIVPISLAMLAGGVAMVLAGCFSMDDAYRAIEWRVVFLIAGFLPLSIALQNTGMADIIGGLVVGAFGSLGVIGFISGVFLVTMLVTQVVGGQVSALLMGPVVIAGALQLGADAQAVGLAAAIACSAAFLTPMSHPVNVLMMGPAGYKPSDFTRVGLLMTVVTYGALIAGLVLFRGVR